MKWWPCLRGQGGDERGAVIEVNDRTLDVFGYGRDEPLGMEQRLVTAAGAARWGELTVAALRDGGDGHALAMVPT